MITLTIQYVQEILTHLIYLSTIKKGTRLLEHAVCRFAPNEQFAINKGQTDKQLTIAPYSGEIA